MKGILSYLTRMRFWPFIFLFTALATLLTQLFVMMFNQWENGVLFDSAHLVAALAIPVIVGFVIFYFIASLIRNLIETQESLKAAEEELRYTNRRLKDAQDIAHLGFWEFDMEKDKLYWSDEVYRIFGLEPQEFVATFEGFMGYVHPDDRERLASEYQRSIEEKSDYSLVHRTVQKNGAIRYVEERCEHTYDSEGNPVHSIGTVYDITERIADQSKLQRLFDLQRNIIIQSDGKLLKKANQSFLCFFDYENLEEFLKEHDCICDLFVEDDRFFHLKKVPEGMNWIVVIEKLPKTEQVVSLLDTRGYPHAFSVSVNHFDDDDYIIAFTDISETMSEQFLLKQKVSRDHLTGAYSRDFFESNIRTLIDSAQKKNRMLGLVMIDIDYFKNVNDTYGHDIGDKVLTHLVSTVRYSVRNDDLLIRWGGEEFLLVVETESAETLNRMAQHVRQRVENEPFETVGQVTCSFGATAYVPDEPISQTIKRADVALYEAKAGGRNRVVLA